MIQFIYKHKFMKISINFFIFIWIITSVCCGSVFKIQSLFDHETKLQQISMKSCKNSSTKIQLLLIFLILYLTYFIKFIFCDFILQSPVQYLLILLHLYLHIMII